MGFIDRVLNRDPQEQIKEWLDSAKQSSSQEKWSEAFKYYQKATSKANEISDEATGVIALKGLITSAIKQNKLDHAFQNLEALAQKYLENNAYGDAAEQYLHQAIVSIYQEKQKQFQLAWLKSGLIYLVNGDIKQVQTLDSQLIKLSEAYKKIDVLPDKGTFGDILSQLIIGLETGKIPHQLPSRISDLIESLKLPTIQKSVIQQILNILHRRSNCQFTIYSAYIEVPTNNAVPLNIDLVVDPKIRIEGIQFQVPPSMEYIPPKTYKNRFTVDFIFTKDGSYEIGPFIALLRDKSGLPFQLQSNTLSLHAETKISDIKIGFKPTTLPLAEETEVYFTLQNSGNTTLYDLNLNFNFSSNIEIKLGSSNKLINSISPNESIQLPLTVMATTADAAEVTAVYSYETQEGKLIKKEGKVVLTILNPP